MTKITQIMNKEEYRSALKRIDEIFQADIGMAEGEELDALVDLVVAYEDLHYPIY